MLWVVGRGSWVVGRGSWVVGRGSWVWVWVNVVGKNKKIKKERKDGRSCLPPASFQ